MYTDLNQINDDTEEGRLLVAAICFMIETYGLRANGQDLLAIIYRKLKEIYPIPLDNF